MFTYVANQGTILEGIPAVTRHAGTGGTMIDDTALGIGAAGARTGILAFGAYAAQSGGTVRVDYALRSTTFVRVPDVIGQTGAGTDAILFLADRVETAW